MKFLTHLIFFQLVFLSSIVLANDNSLYEFKWLDEGEKVYVIQNKEHIKAGGFGVDLSVVDSNSSPYQDTNGFIIGFTYYFTEKWSMDFTYKKYNNENSADLNNLIALTEASNEVKPLVRRIDTAKLIHVNWIPFYGKINTFNKIFFFDWGVGFGVGQFDTAGNYETFDDPSKSFALKEESDTGFNFRSFVKFYTKSSWTMGFEYNLSGVQTIKSEEGNEEILLYNDIMATVGMIF